MNVIVDTNILVRAVVRDNPEQAEIASTLLAEAEVIAIASITLCELARVLRTSYSFKPVEIADSIRLLLSSASVLTNRAAAEFALSLLEAGGDFADGVIAFEGEWLGGDTFVSFDRKAVSLLLASGQPAQLI